MHRVIWECTSEPPEAPRSVHRVAVMQKGMWRMWATWTLIQHVGTYKGEAALENGPAAPQESHVCLPSTWQSRSWVSACDRSRHIPTGVAGTEALLATVVTGDVSYPPAAACLDAVVTTRCRGGPVGRRNGWLRSARLRPLWHIYTASGREREHGAKGTPLVAWGGGGCGRRGPTGGSTSYPIVVVATLQHTRPSAACAPNGVSMC